MDVANNVFKQIQEDEQIAIQAIFADDAKFEINAWKTWRPLSVVIHLTPLESESRGYHENNKPFAWLDLRVICGSTYPDSLPSISFDNVKGLSQGSRSNLTEILAEKMCELVGMPMILDLCEVVRQFLYENNRPPPGSFHDGMLKLQEDKEKEIMRKRQDLQLRQKAELVEERERAELQEEWRRERLDSTPSVSGHGDHSKHVHLGSHRIIQRSNMKTPRKRPHSLCVEYFAEYNGRLCYISSWHFFNDGTVKKNKNFAPMKSRLEEFCRGCGEFVELGEDKTVAPYAFVTVERTSTTERNFDVKIHVAQYVEQDAKPLSAMRSELQQNKWLERRVSAMCVCGLRWLHDQQLYHGRLSQNSVWVSSQQHGYSVRLLDSQVLNQILLLADLFQDCLKDNVSSRNEAPDGKTLRRQDLFALGTLVGDMNALVVCIFSVLLSSSFQCLVNDDDECVCIWAKSFGRGIQPQSPSECSSTEKSDDAADFVRLCQTSKNIDQLMDHRYLCIDLHMVSGNSTGDSALTLNEDTSGLGRLAQEFFVMQWLGKGGFGDVVLARNKLDGSDYAVKRIPLEPGNEQLNRKITREAKLFSQLNHPNVVRYYSAWIEDVERVKRVSPRKSQEGDTSRSEQIHGNDSLLTSRLRYVNRTRERMTKSRISQKIDTSEWSTSFQEISVLDSDSSDSDSDESGPVQTLFRRGSSDDDVEILFEMTHSGGVKIDDKNEVDGSPSSSAVTTKTAKTEHERPIRLLYIQMEYCANSTLRNMIDSGYLYDNANAIWRIFGEILSGLQYIHRMGMIHRDIKPMNIMLDGGGRVKIGDFGLATRDLLSREEVAGKPIGGLNAINKSQTKEVGTALYMSPELNVQGGTYTSKIDVYSTGIVLFEMFYRPLPQGMERISTIRNLKTSTTVPKDFGSQLSELQRERGRKLVEWMIGRDATTRPTVVELVTQLPLSLDGIDETNFQGAFRNAVKKRNGRLFHYVMNTLCEEPVSAALSYVYDLDACKEKFLSSTIDFDIEEVRELVNSLMRKHLFEPLHCHLLVPSCGTNEVRHLDERGMPVTLPVNLRRSFVRYCVRNGIHRIKRYDFGKVFIAKESANGRHPGQRWECSLDCVGPSTAACTFMVETIGIVSQIVKQSLPTTQRVILRHGLLHLYPGDGVPLSRRLFHGNHSIWVGLSPGRIGHAGLLMSAMEHLGIRGASADSIHAAMANTSIAKSLNKDSLSDVLNEKLTRALLGLLPKSETFDQFKRQLGALLHSRVENVAEKTKSVLMELERILKLLIAAWDDLTPVWDASLYSNTYSRGILFSVETEVLVKGSARRIVLAHGGRYDSALSTERHVEDIAPVGDQCIVGATVAVETLAARRGKARKAEWSRSAIVASYKNELLEEKLGLCRMLWSKGLVADVFHEPLHELDSLLEHCERKRVRYVLVVFSREEVLINVDRVNRGKVSFEDAVKLLQKEEESKVELEHSHVHLLSESSFSQSSIASCHITVAIAEKVTFNARKKIENQVRIQLQDPLSLFAAKSNVEVVACELSVHLLGLIVGGLSLGRNANIDEMNVLFEDLSRQHGKSKQDLQAVCEVLNTVWKNKLINVVVLFRISDAIWKVII